MPESLPDPAAFGDPFKSRKLTPEFVFQASFNEAYAHLRQIDEVLRAAGELPMLPMMQNVVHRVLINAQIHAAYNIQQMVKSGIDVSAMESMTHGEIDRLMNQACRLLGIRHEQIKVPIPPKEGE